MPLDIVNDVGLVKALDEQTINSDTTTAGNVIDTETFRGDIAIVLSGKFTAGDLTMSLFEDSAVGMGTATAIPDAAIKPFILSGVKYETGQEAAAIIDGTPAFNVLGLKKDMLKRYIRLSVVSDNSANVIASAFVMQEDLVKSTQGTVVDTLD